MKEWETLQLTSYAWQLHAKAAVVLFKKQLHVEIRLLFSVKPQI